MISRGLNRSWSSYEDDRLLAMVDEGLNWEVISQRLGGRTVSSCRSRYRVLVPAGERKSVPNFDSEVC